MRLPRMRTQLAALLFGAGLAAQSSSLTTLPADHYLSSLDGGVYFDLVVHHELQLDRLDVSLASMQGTSGTIEVHVRPGTWQEHVGARGDWVLAASGSIVSTGAQNAAPCVLNRPIGLPAGRHGIALRCRGVMPAYTFALGLRTSGNGDLSLVGGGSTLHFLSGTPFFSRVFSGTLHYSVGGGPFVMAHTTPFGEGCHKRARSFHEHFAPGGFDLSRQRLVLTPNGAGGYDVRREPAPAVALAAGAQNLGLVRGGAAVVALPAPLAFPGGSTPSLLVLPDGRVLLTDVGLLGSSQATPSPQTLLQGLPAVAVAWHDLAPGGADNVYAHSDPATGASTVTWWRVPVHGAPAGVRSTFAFVAHTDGSLELVFDTVAHPDEGCLVGFGAGHGARDPGGIDLSAVAAFATATDDPGLSLAGEGRAVIGTTTLLRLADAPANAALAALLIGWQPLAPALGLEPLGAPGCHLHVDPTDAVFLPVATTAATAVPVPHEPGLLGLSFVAQAAAFPLAASAAPFVTSNGLQFVIGGT